MSLLKNNSSPGAGDPRPRAGLLPFYLKLYDDLHQERSGEFEEFIARTVRELEARGLRIDRAPVCRVTAEFDAAVEHLEQAGVDAIVTLHLAYSPSMEAIGAFTRTSLPIVILDTSMDADFGGSISPKRIMFNHGIHGVMDFASILRRHKRPFEIVAGSVVDPRLYERAADRVRAALSVRELGHCRALRVGSAFKGMGDFCVDEAVLNEKFGICIDQVGLDKLDEAVRSVTDSAVQRELALDLERYDCAVPKAVHLRSLKVGLGLRRMLDEGGYNALSVNFQAFDRLDRPADTMPFLEISKAMARGVGYGGEGDVLTAALTGALARGFGPVTFTEIFCADWQGESLFLSHMGEISPAVAAGRSRIFEKPFPFGAAANPAVLTCAVKAGPAVFVNLAPGPDDTFGLLVAPVEVLPEDDGIDPGMRDAVRAWIRPRMAVPRFLEAYSRAGGTHHSALVLGDCAEGIAAFGRMCGLDVTEIGCFE